MNILNFVFQLSFIIINIFKIKKPTEHIKSKSGFLILDKYGVAYVDYSNPEAREKLKQQIENFSKIKIN